MLDLVTLLKVAIESKASDVHLTANERPCYRIHGELKKVSSDTLSPEDTLAMVKQALTEKEFTHLEEFGEVDTTYQNNELGRFRVNAYRQRNYYSIVMRVISSKILPLESLGLPASLSELAMKHRGLVLVTGPTGSGKSTTLASMIDYANKNRKAHILTLEDPIEYLHANNNSIINQREIGKDSQTFSSAIRAAMRQDPDIILVGEMRDFETIGTAVTAAETGHLVLSTLHTVGAAKTIDRIIDVFPPHQQQQIRVQLSSIIEGVMSQQLLPREDGSGRVPALEIMIATPAIRNLIREGKTHQIASAMQTGGRLGMKTMDMSIAELYRQRVITKEVAIEFSVDRENMEKTLI